MAIEVKVNEVKERKREYPYLGRHEDGAVVMFIRKETGMCLYPDLTNSVGAMATDWIERDFTPLSPSESITLSNKA